MSILLFCFLFLTLFSLSRNITKLLSRLFLKMFHNHVVVIYLLSFLFLPGIVLHELSHLFVASVLFVQTGEVEFFPEIRGNEIKMGSVAVAKTDPFRRFLIGVAPLIGGLGILLLSSVYLSGDFFSWQNALLFYIVFQIANTMFSSGKDMEGALGFGAGVLLLAIVLQLLRVSVWNTFIDFFRNQVIIDFFTRINFFFLLAIGINIFLVLLFEGIARLNQR